MRVANLGAKALLVLLLLHALVFPDLAQYQHKGMGFRIALYPVPAVLVPLLWRWRGRGAYPHLIDLCVVLPFLMDTAGNAANLYDTITWWDDAMHVLTWIPWVTAVGLTLHRHDLGRLNVFALTVGFGAVTHILWEVGEYLTFVADSPTESASAYRDTIGDLVGSLCGSIVGAALVARVLWDVGTSPVDDRGSAHNSG
jgi:hypothetical protein